MKDQEATDSARITVNKLIDKQALSITSAAIDIFTIVFFVINYWKDHELRTAINLILSSLALVMIWKTVEISRQKRAAAKKDYMEITQEINQRLSDNVLRSEVNRLLK